MPLPPANPLSADPLEQRVSALLAQMTLDEKIGQMVQADLSWKVDLDALVREGRIGSLLTVHDPQVIQRYQRMAVEDSRLGIPLLVGNDVIHGYRTIFPIPLGMACAWDPALVERAAASIAEEAIAAGTTWNFAPMLDIARDPRWGRVAEGAGEDPLLAGVLAAAWVRGFQGASLPDAPRMAACIKHFAAYGAGEGGRDYATVSLGERLLRDVYLPAYRRGLEAGALTVMASFNEFDGIPATANTHLLGEILRGEWGFDGVVVSDYDSIGELLHHGLAADHRQATRLAMRAGVDMDMMGNAYPFHLAELVNSGEIPAAAVDAAARRILRLKFQLGLFDQPYSDPQRIPAVFQDPARRELARQAAEDSLVLLQNRSDVLPIDPAVRRIALIGPLAEDRADLLGCWFFDGQADETPTLAEALRAALPSEVSLTVTPGCTISGDELDEAAVRAAAAQADLLILAVGESADQSGEAHSRAVLDLPGRQAELVELAAASGRPSVAVIFSGRPLLLGGLASRVDALVQAWHPGSMAGAALANVLLGKVNPSGRLTLSFPRSLGQIPVYYAHKRTGRPEDADGVVQFNRAHKTGYIDEVNQPLYPFGFGLSYTRFEYDRLTVETPQVRPDGELVVSAQVTNRGPRDGREVVQLYVRDRIGSVTRPVKELKAFQKVALRSGESQVVRFSLPAAALAFTGVDYRPCLEAGDFQVWIGPDSQSGLRGEFSLLEG